MARDFIEELLENKDIRAKVELALALHEVKIRKAISSAILTNRLLENHQVARDTASYIALKCDIKLGYSNE